MGFLRDLVDLAKEAENTGEAYSPKERIDDSKIELGPVNRDLNIQQLLFVKKRNLIDLEDVINVAEGNKLTLYLQDGRDGDNTIYLGLDKVPDVNEGDYLYFVNEDYEIEGVNELGSESFE